MGSVVMDFGLFVLSKLGILKILHKIGLIYQAWIIFKASETSIKRDKLSYFPAEVYKNTSLQVSVFRLKNLLKTIPEPCFSSDHIVS